MFCDCYDYIETRLKRQFFFHMVTHVFDNSNLSQEIFAIDTWGAVICSLGHGLKHMLTIFLTIWRPGFTLKQTLQSPKVCVAEYLSMKHKYCQGQIHKSQVNLFLYTGGPLMFSNIHLLNSEKVFCSIKN